MRSLALPALLLALMVAGCGGKDRAEVERLREQLAQAHRSLETVRQLNETALRDQAARQAESARANQSNLTGVVLAIFGGALAVMLYARIRGRTSHAS